MRSTVAPAICATALLALACLAPGAAVAQEPPVVAKATLTGASEVPPNATDEVGTCYLTAPDETDAVVIVCQHTVEGATAAHIHVGGPDEIGPPLVPLGLDFDDPFSHVFFQPEGFLGMLLAGDLYVNIHTEEYPGGVIRGQLMPLIGPEDFSVTFPLLGSQEVPPVDTESSGTCTATLMDDGDTLLLSCVHDIAEPTAAHIHIGEPGVAGGVVVPLDDATSPIMQVIPLSEDLLASLQAGDLYVNVHTEANPDGEIRGQIAGCISGPEALCLQDDRFRVTVDWDSGVDAGSGRAVPDTADSGLFWFFEPDNREVLIKVLDGCDITGYYWVFFAATTDVAFDITVVDTWTGESKVYSNELGHPADPVTDTSAFDTCDAGTEL